MDNYIIYLSKWIEYTILRLKPSINQGLWVIMICPCQCTYCNKYTALLRIISSAGSCVYLRRADVRSLSIQFISVTQWCQTLCNPMDYSAPGFPVHHQPPELPQTHGHWVGDTIQPSSPLPSPFLLAFNISQHKGLLYSLISQFFASGGKNIGTLASDSVLPMNIQSWFPLGLTGLISLQFKGLSSLLQHQFKLICSSVLSFLYGRLSHPYITTGKTIVLTRPDLCQQSYVSAF